MMRLHQGRSFWRLGAASLWLTCSSCGDATWAAPEVYGNSPVTPRIVAGSTDIPDYAKSTGALLITTQQGSDPVHTRLCTATLIAPDAIITAAHCKADKASMGFWQDGQPLFMQPEGGMPHTNPTLRGTQRRQRAARVWYSFCLLDTVTPAAGVTQNGSAQCIATTAFEVHPNYHLPGPWDTGLVDAYDVGILRLAQPIDTVPPAALMGADEAAGLGPKQAVSIVGYGSTIDHAALGPAAQASGLRRFARSAIGKLSTAEMTVGEPPCAAHKSFGDSGGPTFIETPEGPKLVGVTSRLQAERDASLGTVDTRLDAVAEWVRQTAQLDDDDDSDADTACGACTGG